MITTGRLSYVDIFEVSENVLINHLMPNGIIMPHQPGMKRAIFSRKISTFIFQIFPPFELNNQPLRKMRSFHNELFIPFVFGVATFINDPPQTSHKNDNFIRSVVVTCLGNVYSIIIPAEPISHLVKNSYLFFSLPFSLP